ADAQVIYGSTSSLYVATQKWIDPQTPPDELPRSETTVIHPDRHCTSHIRTQYPRRLGSRVYPNSRASLARAIPSAVRQSTSRLCQDTLVSKRVARLWGDRTDSSSWSVHDPSTPNAASC